MFLKLVDIKTPYIIHNNAIYTITGEGWIWKRKFRSITPSHIEVSAFENWIGVIGEEREEVLILFSRGKKYVLK